MEVRDLIVLPFTVENTEDWRFQVLVGGEDFPNKSIGFAARLGDQQLGGVRVTADGQGFSGYLVAAPENGARLFVTTSGLEEIDTGFVFTVPEP